MSTDKKKAPNTGAESFSIDLDQLESNFTSSAVSFFIYYVIVFSIFFSFIYNIRMQIFEKGDYRNITVRNRILNITHSLDKYFQPLFFDCPFIGNTRYYGLTLYSYIILIIIYSIAFIVLLKNMLSTYTLANVLGCIQINPNVNPYNNPNTVTKITDSVFTDTHTQYSKYLSLSLLLLIPISIYYIINYMEWTQYDIKKSFIIKFTIFLMIFLPPIIVIFSSLSMNNFKNGEKYLEEKDKKYLDKMNDRINYTYYGNILPLLIPIFVFCFIIYIYKDMTDSKLWYIALFGLYVLVPAMIGLIGFNLIFDDFQDPLICSSKGYSNNIEQAVKAGINNIYQGTVKYNYPCFFK